MTLWKRSMHLLLYKVWVREETVPGSIELRADLEFGNKVFFHTHVPQTTPTLIDHTHQCIVIM